MNKSNIFSNIDKNLLEKFKKHLTDNPDIYKEFKKASFEMKDTGKKKYSAWAIINKIRWESDIKKKGDSAFKISNDYIALYARLLIHHHPEMDGFFELKKMKSCNRKISSEETERIRG